MFRALPRPSSGAYNCISSLWFYRWSVAVAALLVDSYLFTPDFIVENNGMHKFNI
jgi:hypothetical protein